MEFMLLNLSSYFESLLKNENSSSENLYSDLEISIQAAFLMKQLLYGIY